VIARNLEPIYGIDAGLRAMVTVAERYPGLQVSIAGSGPDRASLEALAARLGLSRRVRFTGRLELQQMVELYQSADVVLNPSRVDNTPNSILEALACGVPVVSTNVGGIPFLVRHGHTAWLTEPESPEALATGMLEVLSDAGLRETLVANGMMLARSCAWPAVREQWLAAYREARAA
jgi:glycosyltransferase involved in cell wall biosynthesis